MAKCKRCGIKTVLSEADIEKMVNEVKAMRSVRLVSSEVYAERFGVCRECESFLYGSTCSVCGCVMQVRALLADGRCPEKEMVLKLFNKHFICVFCDERKRAGDEYIKRGDIGICKECCKIVGENARMQPFPGKRDTAFLLTPFEYREPLRGVILDYKFKNCRAYAPLLGEMMKDYLMSFDIWQDVDMIIPVPLHEKRLKERGYNQAELLANYVSEYTKVPLNTAALTRVRNTRRQSGLKGTDRITNVAGAFKCGEDMRGKTIVLLDDIYTTGNTIQSCAAPLKEAGAYRICAVTLAKHTFEKNPASMY